MATKAELRGLDLALKSKRSLDLAIEKFVAKKADGTVTNRDRETLRLKTMEHRMLHRSQIPIEGTVVNP